MRRSPRRAASRQDRLRRRRCVGTGRRPIPSLLRELTRSGLSFAHGASLNTMDELAGAGTWLSHKMGMSDDGRPLREIAADYDKRLRGASSDYPVGHGAGRVTAGALLGLAGPASAVGQAAVAGGAGALNRYADDRNLGWAAGEGAIDAATAGVGTWGANRIARAFARSPQAAERASLEAARQEGLAKHGAEAVQPSHPMLDAPPPVPEPVRPLPVPPAEPPPAQMAPRALREGGRMPGGRPMPGPATPELDMTPAPRPPAGPAEPSPIEYMLGDVDMTPPSQPPAWNGDFVSEREARRIAQSRWAAEQAEIAAKQPKGLAAEVLGLAAGTRGVVGRGLRAAEAVGRGISTNPGGLVVNPQLGRGLRGLDSAGNAIADSYLRDAHGQDAQDPVRVGPAPRNDWTPTYLSPAEERKFQADMQTGEGYRQWREQFEKQWDTKVDFNDPEGDYDYRGAWKAGMRPAPYEFDDNKYHWGSKAPDGHMLKAPDHPTAWMQHFMERTGVDPGSLGLKNEVQGKQYEREQVAYGDRNTLNYALSAALHGGDTGLSQEDEATLTKAVVAGDQDAINAADFRLRQRYPAYARRIERELRALNEEE